MYVHISCRLVFLYHVDADLEMFGSSANGFGSKTSDLDICLTLPGHDKVHPHMYYVVYLHEKNISGVARQAILRSLDSAVSSLLALISREYVQLVQCTTGLYTEGAPER